jgi:hypothetical protein
VLQGIYSRKTTLALAKQERVSISHRTLHLLRKTILATRKSKYGYRSFIYTTFDGRLEGSEDDTLAYQANHTSIHLVDPKRAQKDNGIVILSSISNNHGNTQKDIGRIQHFFKKKIIFKKKINFFEKKNIIPHNHPIAPQTGPQGTGTTVERIEISKKKLIFLKRISSPPKSSIHLK